MKQCGQRKQCQKYVIKKASRKRWKKEIKYKSQQRGHNHRLQKHHIYYASDLSQFSNEAWKNERKQAIYLRYREIHPLKEAETKYKGFIGLQPKVNSERIDETIKQVDTPTEFVNHSAAVRELNSINLHRTGSKDCCEPAANSQISIKNLD
jgi:hypothetical protein